MSENTAANPLEEFEKRTSQLFEDLKNDKPIECSPELRELAKKVVAQREEELKNPLTEKQIKQWAKNLVKSMYGEK